MKALYILLALNFVALDAWAETSAPTPSACAEVENRIHRWHSFLTQTPAARLGQAAAHEVTLSKDGDLWVGVEYRMLFQKKPGTLAMLDHRLYCAVTALDMDTFFPPGYIYAVNIPDQQGSCSVLGTAFRDLVGRKDLPLFIEGGFCTYPIFVNPTVSWLMTSAFVPALHR